MNKFISNQLQTQIITVPIYDRDVVVCCDKHELPKFGIDTTHWIEPDSTCEGRTLNNMDTGTTVILFRDKHPKAGVIAHECLHTMNFILERCGVTPARMNDEADAYLLQFLIEAVNVAVENINKYEHTVEFFYLTAVMTRYKI